MTIITILVAVVILNAVGFLWYSPLMFVEPWMNLSGHVKKDIDSAMKKKMARDFSINILLTIVTSIVVYSLISAGFRIFDIFAIWSAFALPVFAGDVLWDGKPLKLFLIKAGCSLVSIAYVSQAILWMI